MVLLDVPAANLLTSSRHATEEQAIAEAMHCHRNAMVAVRYFKNAPSAVREANEKPWVVQSFGIRVVNAPAVPTADCLERIAGTQNLCTRDKGHDGEHRCSAADVDEKKWAAVRRVAEALSAHSDERP